MRILILRKRLIGFEGSQGRNVESETRDLREVVEFGSEGRKKREGGTEEIRSVRAI